MSKKTKSSAKSTKSGSVVWTLLKVGCLMICCTAASAVLISLLAAYQMIVSVAIGAVATLAIVK